MTVGKLLAISTCVVLGLMQGPPGSRADEAARSAQELESAVDQLEIVTPRIALRPHAHASDEERACDGGGLVTLKLRRTVDKRPADAVPDEDAAADEDAVVDAESAADEAAATDETDCSGEESGSGDEAESDIVEAAPSSDESDATAGAASSDSATASDASVTPAAPDATPVVAAPEKPAAPPAPELSPRMASLRNKIHRVLSYYYRQSLNTRDHNPWEMMHGVIAYGCDTKIHLHGPQGQRVNGISYLSTNAPCHGVRLMYIDGKQRLNVQIGQYVQGHAGQLMAILAQCHVPIDYPIHFDGRKFEMRDLIETEMKTCEPNSELTFKLIGFSHYLDTETTWADEHGRKWSIPRLIHEEIRQPILNTAACGGTHRLMGLSYCNYKRAKEGRPVEGEYQRAQIYIRDYHKYAFALQNPDGSFSTDWFKSRQNKPDIDRKLKTTGHILEWLAFSLPQDQLLHPKMIRAVDFIATILDEGRGRKWEIGPIGHSLHALRIYDRRQFPAPTETPAPAPAAPLAQTPTALPDAATGDVTAADSAAVEQPRSDTPASDATTPVTPSADTPRVAQRPNVAEATSDDPFDGPSPAEAEDLFADESGEKNGMASDDSEAAAVVDAEKTEDDTVTPESADAAQSTADDAEELPAEPAIRVRPILPGTTDARAARRIRAGQFQRDQVQRDQVQRDPENSLRVGPAGVDPLGSLTSPPPIPADPNGASSPQPAAPRRGVDNSLRPPMRRRVR